MASEYRSNIHMPLKKPNFLDAVLNAIVVCTIQQPDKLIPLKYWASPVQWGSEYQISSVFE